MKQHINWRIYKDRLRRKIEKEQAYLSSIDRGWTRVQRREPGQIQWSDYTATEAQRSTETIAALTAILDVMEQSKPQPS